MLPTIPLLLFLILVVLVFRGDGQQRRSEFSLGLYYRYSQGRVCASRDSGRQQARKNNKKRQETKKYGFRGDYWYGPFT